MPNKYCFALTRAEKPRILARKIMDKYTANGTPLTLANFSDYCELLESTIGVDTTFTIYELLSTETA